METTTTITMAVIPLLAVEEAAVVAFLQEPTSVIRVTEKASAHYVMVRAGAVHTNAGHAMVQVDAASVTDGDTFTRITVEVVHRAVHPLVEAHRAAVRQAAAAQQEHVPSVWVQANVCLLVTINIIAAVLVNARLAVEKDIITDFHMKI